LPLLAAYRDALVRRDLAAIDSLHARLQPVLERLERLRLEGEPPAEPTPSHPTGERAGVRGSLEGEAPAEPIPPLPTGEGAILQEALHLARAVDEIIQSAYDIILNELDYNHALIAMLTRAAEREHYAPTPAPADAPAVLLNTEV
jgi:hypothetical protein